MEPKFALICSILLGVLIAAEFAEADEIEDYDEASSTLSSVPFAAFAVPSRCKVNEIFWRGKCREIIVSKT